MKMLEKLPFFPKSDPIKPPNRVVRAICRAYDTFIALSLPLQAFLTIIALFTLIAFPVVFKSVGLGFVGVLAVIIFVGTGKRVPITGIVVSFVISIVVTYAFSPLYAYFGVNPASLTFWFLIALATVTITRNPTYSLKLTYLLTGIAPFTLGLAILTGFPTLGLNAAKISYLIIILIRSPLPHYVYRQFKPTPTTKPLSATAIATELQPHLPPDTTITPTIYQPTHIAIYQNNIYIITPTSTLHPIKETRKHGLTNPNINIPQTAHNHLTIANHYQTKTRIPHKNIHHIIVFTNPKYTNTPPQTHTINDPNTNHTYTNLHTLPLNKLHEFIHTHNPPGKTPNTKLATLTP